MLALVFITLAFEKLGSVLSVIYPIVGQLGISLFLDNFGFLGLSKSLISFNQVIGIALVFLGLLFYVNKSHAGKKGSQASPVYALLALLGGICLGIQPAMNASLGKALGSSMASSLVSVSVSALLLLFYTAFIEKSLSQVNLSEIKVSKPMDYLGGIWGGLWVLGNTYLIHLIGAGALVVFILVGQMTCSLFIDLTGSFQDQKKKVHLLQLVGLLLMVFGVIIIEISH